MSRKHSLEHFNLPLCVSPAFFSAPGREEWRVHHPMWVSEWERGRAGERAVVCSCMCEAKRHRTSISVSDELHNHFLPAFKPSLKSLLFNPLSCLSSFFRVILKYLAKILLCNFFSKSIYHCSVLPCHLKAEVQQQFVLNILFINSQLLGRIENKYNLDKDLLYRQEVKIRGHSAAYDRVGALSCGPLFPISNPASF